MRGQFYKKSEKDQAKKMLSSGASYSAVYKTLGIPKSTLSTWFSNSMGRPWTKDKTNKHLSKIRTKAIRVIKEKYQKIREAETVQIEHKVKEYLKYFPTDNPIIHKTLLAMLYWAEGSKGARSSGLKFVNTDPDLALLYLNLLRGCYRINEEKISIGLHVHYYHNIGKTKSFWSRLLKVPIIQFNKVYIKKRSQNKRFRKNFVGICSIYCPGSSIRRELLMLGLALAKSMSKTRPSFNG